MSGTLGIGVRVYVGWVARGTRGWIGEGNVHCRTGEIVNGPFPPGHFTFKNPIGAGRYESLDTCWIVHLDNDPSGDNTLLDEKLLSPIDDDPPKAELRERELERTT